MSRVFVVTAERGRGNWWVLEAPAVGAVSQVRSLVDVEREMREPIAYLAGIGERDVEIDLQVIFPVE